MQISEAKMRRPDSIMNALGTPGGLKRGAAQ